MLDLQCLKIKKKIVWSFLLENMVLEKISMKVMSFLSSFKLKNVTGRWAQWCTPVVPALEGAEAGGL